MISAKSYFARMNQNRNENHWLQESHLLRGVEEFFRLNNYFAFEYDKTLNRGMHTFSSPIVGYRQVQNSKKQSPLNDSTDRDSGDVLISILRPRIDQYNHSLIGYLESILYDVMDNYDLQTKLILVTDSLSYIPIIRLDELNVAIQNLMEEGLYLLFLYHRYSYAFFDKFENLTKPIAVYQ